MEQTAVIARLEARPEEVDALRSILEELVDNSSRENGTVVYALHADVKNDTVFWFYELYEDDAAVKAHNASPEFTDAVSRFGPLLAARPELTKLRPMAAKGMTF